MASETRKMTPKIQQKNTVLTTPRSTHLCILLAKFGKSTNMKHPIPDYSSNIMVKLICFGFTSNLFPVFYHSPHFLHFFVILFRLTYLYVMLSYHASMPWNAISWVFSQKWKSWAIPEQLPILRFLYQNSLFLLKCVKTKYNNEQLLSKFQPPFSKIC